MNAKELKMRTQQYALSVIHLAQKLPSHTCASIIARQLIGCSTSVGANYRAACRAKSRSDFIAKLKIVEEECDESIYWLELLDALSLGNTAQISGLKEEAHHLLAIMVASIRTARESLRTPPGH